MNQPPLQRRVLFLFLFNYKETYLKKKSTEKAKKRNSIQIHSIKETFDRWKETLLFSRSRALRHAFNFMHDRVHDSSLANQKRSYIKKYISKIYALDSAHGKIDV